MPTKASFLALTLTGFTFAAEQPKPDLSTTRSFFDNARKLSLSEVFADPAVAQTTAVPKVCAIPLKAHRVTGFAKADPMAHVVPAGPADTGGIAKPTIPACKDWN